MANKKTTFIRGKHLSRNVLWNLLGTGAPLLVAIVAIPALIETLGIERFGVLTIAWMIVGYFSLFDLGLGRALTKIVAEMLASGRTPEIPVLIWTAMLLLMILGVVGAIIFATLSPWLVGSVLKIPFELQSETLIAFYILAASIPIVIGSTGLRGVLEAHQRFGLVNAVRMPLGVATFLGPVAVLPFSDNLAPVVAVLVVARLASWCAYLVLCLHVEPNLKYPTGVNRQMVRSLLSFGSWMTVTNIVSPLMVYLDRFLIGAVISIAAVSYYATPYEVITRLFIIPVAFMGVMFPAFSAALAQDRSRAARLYDKTVIYIFLAIYPVVLIISTFSHEGLSLWLGREFADNSALVLQLLAIGVLLNSIANVPFGLVQSAGRPDLAAKLHMAELPFYLLILWWLLNEYGIVGAAISWMVRVAVDAVVLFAMASKLLSPISTISRRSLLLVGLSLLFLALGATIPGLAVKWLFLMLTLLVFTAVAWFLILSKEDKRIIFNWR